MNEQKPLPNSPCPLPANAFAQPGPSSQPLTYDFRLVKVRPGEDPRDTIRRSIENSSSTQSGLNEEPLKDRIAQALIQHDPRLQIAQFRYDLIACFEHISFEQARAKYRQVELSGPPEGTGIQIALRDNEVCVALPFWHESTRAAEVFQVVWGYFQVMAREMAVILYDPQLERILEVQAVCPESLEKYCQAVHQIRRSSSAAERAATEFEIRELVLSGGAGVVLVAMPGNGVPCGYAEVSLRNDFESGTDLAPKAYLTGWYVDAAFEQGEVGRRLREAAAKWAQARGCGELKHGSNAERSGVFGEIDSLRGRTLELGPAKPVNP